MTTPESKKPEILQFTPVKHREMHLEDLTHDELKIVMDSVSRVHQREQLSISPDKPDEEVEPASNVLNPNYASFRAEMDSGAVALRVLDDKTYSQLLLFADMFEMNREKRSILLAGAKIAASEILGKSGIEVGDETQIAEIESMVEEIGVDFPNSN